MSDVELVIKISEEHYENLLKNCRFSSAEIPIVSLAIATGTPLPKGHGRVIDESKITKCEQIGLVIKDDSVARCLKTDAPTIIEADKESEG